MKNIDFALDMERDGAAYYTKAAGTIADQTAAAMLLSLARDEENHERVIRQMQEGNPALFQSSDFKEVKNIFQLLADTKSPYFKEGDNLAAVLKKALQMEKKSVQLYEFLADERNDPAERQLFRNLAEEETKHVQILNVTLENLNAPHNILENAEFLYNDDVL